MRREGRQRGMVRTLPTLSAQNNPRPSYRRTLNEISAPPTAGAFTRAPTKPTNHSKFTGKCARPRCRDCHIEPACKCKDKAKGAHKLRSASSELRAKVSGYSATGVLDYFDGDEGYESEEGGFRDSDRGSHGANTLSFRDIIDIVACDDRDDDGDDTMSFRDIVYNAAVAAVAGTDDGSSGGSSFCEVGFALASMDGDDKGWCLVEDLS